MAAREITVRILGDATSAQRALGSLDASTDKTESRFAKFGTVMKAAMVGASLAAVKFGKDSVDAFNESRKVGAQTEAVLRSTGGAAGVTGEHVGKLAEKLQRLSGVEDEAIQTGQNMLLTFTGIRNEAGKGNDIFDQATRSMLDMSVAMGTDAKSSAMQLGKALNDPVGGISALTRVGVQFTDEQKATIRTMVEMGDKAGAQRVILAELNKEFGGSAKAAGDAQSPMERLSLRFGELQEKVGAKLIPALEKLTAVGLGVIEFVEGLDPGVIAVIASVAAFAAGVLVVTKVVQAWTAVQAALNLVLSLNPIVAITLLIAALVAGIIVAYQKSETFRDIVQGAFGAVAAAAGFMKDVAVGAFTFMVDKFLAAAEWIVRAAASAFGWVPGLGGKLRGAAEDIERFRDQVNATLRGVDAVKINVDTAVARQQVADLAGAIRRDLGNVLVGLDVKGRVGDGPGRGRVGTALATVQQAMAGIPGLAITSTYRSPARNAAVGGSPRSWHLDRNNPAVDVIGPMAGLDALNARLARIGGRELLWRVPGHRDHLHYAHEGGIVSSSWPTLPGLRSDERPAILQVGEQVVPKAGAGAPSVVVEQGAVQVAVHAGPGMDEAALARLMRREVDEAFRELTRRVRAGVR